MADPIRPQRGPQGAALTSPADVVVFGGAAGGGKTFSLLLKPLQFVDIPTFSAVIFRRESPEITNPGSLWDESSRIYLGLGASPNRQLLEWRFPSGARVKFAHMQYEDDKFAWKSSQIPLVGFDQLESFAAGQFWYMLSRNRDPSGRVRSHVFGTCNPVPADDAVGGWLRELISWWIDPGTGLALEARAGAVRWLARAQDGDAVEWYDSAAAAAAARPGAQPKSFTFIPSRLADNPILERADPGYRASLMLLPLVERERLLGGNWNVRPTAGKVFNRAWFPVVDAAPAEARRVRYWDKASTEGAGDYSAGVRMARVGGVYYVEDVVRDRWSALNRNRVMRQVAEADGPEVEVWVEQEGGSGGKESAEITVMELAGYSVRADRVSGAGSKLVRAGPLSAQAEAGNVRLVRAEWNEEYLRELHGFPDGRHDDQVDASSGAFAKLALDGPTEVGVLGQPAGPRRVIVRP